MLLDSPVSFVRRFVSRTVASTESVRMGFAPVLLDILGLIARRLFCLTQSVIPIALATGYVVPASVSVFPGSRGRIALSLSPALALSRAFLALAGAYVVTMAPASATASMRVTIVLSCRR